QINRRTGSVPVDILPPEPAAAQGRMSFPKRNHAFEKTEDVLIPPELAPVQPSSFVVLVIGIVITVLRVQEFIPGPEHWDPVRQQQQAAEILNLLPAQRQHGRWRSFVSFVPTVPTV